MRILGAGGIIGAALALRGSYNPAAASAAVEAAPAAHVYEFEDATSVGDPSTILVEPAEATDNRGEVSFQITAGTSTVPDATDIGGTYVEWRIVDVNGNPATIASTDARQFWAWLSRTVGLLPVDCYMGVALTGTTPGAAAGVANIGNSGLFAGIRYSATGNEAFMHANAGGGSGWGAATVGGAVDPLTRGVRPDVLAGTTNNSALRQTIPLDAAGERSSTSSTTATVPAATNIMTDGPFTHVALVVGRSGTGGSTATILAGLRSFATALSQLVDYAPVVDPAATVIADPPSRFLFIGESNFVGPDVAVNPTWAGVAVQSGWTGRHNGVNFATYGATNSPGVGPIPFAIEAARARGATGGWVIRRATSGVDTGWPGTMVGQFAGAVADVAALDDGDPDLIGLCFGANDTLSTQAVADAFLPNMRRGIKVLQYEFPGKPIVLFKERTTTPLTYVFFPDIYAHLLALVAEFDGVYIADSTTAPAADLADGIHFSSADGGGLEVMVDRMFAAVYG